MFSSSQLEQLGNDPANQWLAYRLLTLSKIMVEVENKAKELYETKKPRMDSCGTSLHKIWVMEDMMFGPSIHLELLGEHWSFWVSDDDLNVIESHKHENHRKR